MRKRKSMAISGGALLVILLTIGLCLFTRKGPGEGKIALRFQESALPICIDKGPWDEETITVADIFGELGVLPEPNDKLFEERKRSVIDKIDQLIKSYEEGKKPKTTISLADLRKLRDNIQKSDSPPVVIFGGGFREMSDEERKAATEEATKEAVRRYKEEVKDNATK